MRWIIGLLVCGLVVGCGDDESSIASSGSGSASGSAGTSNSGSASASGGGTGSPQDCGAPGHTIDLIVDGQPVELSPVVAPQQTDSPNSVSIGASRSDPVEGFSIGEEKQIMIFFIGLAPGELAASEDSVAILYQEFPAANEPRPADVMVSGPVTGSVTVIATAGAEQDPVCGEYTLTVQGQRSLEVSGHFNYAYVEPVPQPGG